MTIEQDLRAELAERAETFTVPGYDVAGFRAGAVRRRTRRQVRVGVAVAASLAVAGGVWLSMPTTQQHLPALDPSEDVLVPCPRDEAPPVPSSPWAGPDYLADENWTRQAPSEGRTCVSVLKLGYHRSSSLGAGRSGMLWLYSDGTLITETQGDGFVQHQRRLTARGVERIRALVVSYLGDPDQKPATDDGGTYVRYRGQWYTPDDPELRYKLEDLSWLSDADWQQPKPTVYRPAWYLLCHEQKATQGVDSALESLPRATRSLLESNQWTVLPRSEATQTPRNLCTILTPDVAGLLAQRLGGDVQDGEAIVVWPGGPGGWSLTGLMPHGESGAHGD